MILSNLEIKLKELKYLIQRHARKKSELRAMKPMCWQIGLLKLI